MRRIARHLKEHKSRSFFRRSMHALGGQCGGKGRFSAPLVAMQTAPAEIPSSTQPAKVQQPCPFLSPGHPVPITMYSSQVKLNACLNGLFSSHPLVRFCRRVSHLWSPLFSGCCFSCPTLSALCCRASCLHQSTVFWVSLWAGCHSALPFSIQNKLFGC